MTYEELEEALDELFPDGYAVEFDDHNGRVIIITNLVEDDEGDLYPMSEEDEDFDPDLDPLDEDDDEDE